MRTLDVEAIRLGRSSHPPADTLGDGNACVMEAAAWVAGEPWTDQPACVSPVIGAFLRSWNDSLDDTDRQQLRRWVLPVIGTAADEATELHRSFMACDWLVRTFTPAWLRNAGLVDDATALESLPELTTTALVEAALPIIRRARDGAAAAWAAGSAAWAGSAARWAALADTVVALQASAHELVGRMVALSHEVTA